MAWSSFEKDKLLAEGWRKFLVEEQTVFGINSKDNTESLYSFLDKNKDAIGLTPEQVEQLVALMLAQTKEDDVVLEAIGGPQRDARTFSSDTTTKLNALINKFQLKPANQKKLEKVLNRWAKLNTVTFEPGEAATPAMVTYEPDEDEEAPTPAAEPKQTSRGIDYEPYGATGATPEKRADNLVVTQKGNFDAETGSPISEEGRDSIIKQIAAATKETEFYEAYQKLANSKFSNDDRKKSFDKANRDDDPMALSGFGAGDRAQQVIRQKFIDLFLNGKAPTPPEKKRMSNPAETAVDLLNKIDAGEQEEITVELFNDFVRDLKSFIGEINKEKSVSEINRQQVATKLNIDIRQLNNFIRKNDKYRLIFNRLRFANKDEKVLNSFLKSYEQVAKSLSADTPTKTKPKAAATPTEPDSEPEAVEPEIRSIEKSLDPNFTRRGTKRIKDYYNSLEIVQKLSSKFYNWKQGIERIAEVKSIEKEDFEENNSLYVITLTDGQQFGLPKQSFSSAIEFAFEEEGESTPGSVPLRDVLKLAKIKDGKVIQKGLVDYGTKVNESLMLRWKTIAGIK